MNECPIKFYFDQSLIYFYDRNHLITAMKNIYKTVKMYYCKDFIQLYGLKSTSS